jgi:excisionase family DNA binding protein
VDRGAEDPDRSIFRAVPSRPAAGRGARGDGTHLARVVVVQSTSVQPAPLLLTVSDTARRLNRHEQTVRAMIRRGDLAAVRLGRLVRVFAAAVEETLPVPMAAEGDVVPPAVSRRVVRRLLARARA